MSIWDRDYVKEREKNNQFKFSKSKKDYEFDKKQKIKLQEFKQTWNLKEKSTIKPFSFIFWIVAIIIILAISKEIHKHSINDKASPISEQSSNIIKPAIASEILPIPSTSVLSTGYNLDSAICPLTFIADNQNYYVKLCDSHSNGATVAKFFIRAGETLKTKVPSGQYTIKYGGGGDWYGENELFGAFNEYKQSEILDFTFDGITSSGHTIFFQKAVDGNFHADDVGRDTIRQN